jgi:flagellar basal-body rod protein FlgF
LSIPGRPGDRLKRWHDQPERTPSGAIGLFAIDANASFTRSESSSVVPDKPATPILEFTRGGIIQGAVESSNVDPVREMTRLIEVTRAFDGAASETSQTEASLQDAIKTLGSAA